MILARAGRGRSLKSVVGSEGSGNFYRPIIGGVEMHIINGNNEVFEMRNSK